MKSTRSTLLSQRAWLAAGLVASLAAAAALVPSSVSAAASKCSYPSLTKPFAPWSDTADYTLVTGGSFEQTGNAAWTLAGAKIVAGNETFFVHGKGESKSLSLPDLSTATTPVSCVSEATPSIRFFAKNDGALSSALTVDAGVAAGKGTTWTRLATLTASTPDWSPSPIILLNLPKTAFASGTAKVVFRFTAQGGGGAWQIDDLYLDPFKRT